MRKLHQTIKKVSSDIPALSYNTAIAAMMEYINVVRREERTAHRAEVEPLVQLVSPFAPHVAEELWERMGHDQSVFDSGWPSFDPAIAAEDLADDRGAGEREDTRHRADPDRRRPGRRASRRARRSGHREIRDRRAEESHLRSGATAQHRRLSICGTCNRKKTTATATTSDSTPRRRERRELHTSQGSVYKGRDFLGTAARDVTGTVRSGASRAAVTRKQFCPGPLRLHQASREPSASLRPPR